MKGPSPISCCTLLDSLSIHQPAVDLKRHKYYNVHVQYLQLLEITYNNLFVFSLSIFRPSMYINNNDNMNENTICVECVIARAPSHGYRLGPPPPFHAMSLVARRRPYSSF
jgi:hypothetical protein